MRRVLPPTSRLGRRRRHAKLSLLDAHRRERWYRPRSSAASFVQGFANLLPSRARKLRLKAVTFETCFTQLERVSPLALGHHLSQPLLDQRSNGGPFPGGQLARFFQQRVGYLYGCLHMGICIMRAANPSRRVVKLKPTIVLACNHPINRKTCVMGWKCTLVDPMTFSLS